MQLEFGAGDAFAAVQERGELVLVWPWASWTMEA